MEDDKMKCQICGEHFNPAILSSAVSHEHIEDLNAAESLGIKGEMVEKHFTDSVNVKRIGYDKDYQIMQVEFANNKKYDYKDVPYDVFISVINAAIGNYDPNS